MEVYGRRGTLVAVSEDSPQLGEVHLHGAQDGNALQPMTVPQRFVHAPAGTPSGEAFNVGQMYAQFAQAIRRGKDCEPNFETAVRLHRLIDAIKRASDSGGEVKLS
jgi:predicted dehydrogenase